MCYVGQHLVFEEAEHVINNLTGAGFNAKQIERVCHDYGGRIETRDLGEIEVNGYEEVSPAERDKLHYVSVDGSMYLTREGGWKEIKLGRIYKDEDLVTVSKDRGSLAGSQYVAHLGGIGGFLPKMEYHIENLDNKVFLADGAVWIWNWVEDTYPDSVQIVDFYHAKEHLCGFARERFKDPGQRRKWAEEQGGTMLEKGIGPVIEALEGLPGDEGTDGKRSQLIAYYEKHRHRMQYHDFLEDGLQIGSGAMESAHKDVLQARLKLSGQRWTMGRAATDGTVKGSVQKREMGQDHGNVQKSGLKGNLSCTLSDWHKCRSNRKPFPYFLISFFRVFLVWE